MFLRKNVLFVLMVGFFVTVLNGTGFTQETEEDEEEVISPDTTEAYIPASYQPVELVREFGSGVFKQCAQVVFSSDKKVIYVSDLTACEVLAFNYEGDLLLRFGGQMAGYRANVGSTDEEKDAGRKAYDEERKNKLCGLINLGIDAKGNIYAVDYGDNGVKVFAPDGKFVLKISLQASLQKRSPGSGASGVAINSRGDIYITDSANGRIEVNDLNGKYKYQISKFRNKAGEEIELVTPAHPRINNSDEVYIIDPLVCKVYRFNTDGDYLGGFGYMGDGAGGFNAPNGLAIDKLGRVYITDKGNNVIQVFSEEGKFLYALCDEKGRKLEIPFVSGIGVDSDGLIYVSAIGAKGWHVKVFKYLTK